MEFVADGGHLGAEAEAGRGTWRVGCGQGRGQPAGLRAPARNALLADVVPRAAYGFERAMDNLGAAGGPLLGSGC